MIYEETAEFFAALPAVGALGGLGFVGRRRKSA